MTRTLYVIAHIGTQPQLGGIFPYDDDAKDEAGKAYERAHKEAMQQAKSLAEEGYTGPKGIGIPTIHPYIHQHQWLRKMRPVRLNKGIA